MPDAEDAGSLAFGDWMAHQRGEKSWTQAELGARLGYSAEQIRSIEAGRRGGKLWCRRLATAARSVRACLKRSGRQPAQHQAGHGDVDQRLARGRQLLIILAQPPALRQPRERALNHPAAGQHDKALHVV